MPADGLQPDSPRRAGYNDTTLASYERAAERYSASTRPAVEGALAAWLGRFASAVGKGHTVLEVGSGTGRDARYMETQGLSVVRSDACLAFREQMEREGTPALAINVLTDNLGGPWTGIVADAVFLHFTPHDLRTIVRHCKDALVPGGTLAFTVRDGDAGSRWPDTSLGEPRFYHDWHAPALKALLTSAGFTNIQIELDDSVWLHVIATAPA